MSTLTEETYKLKERINLLEEALRFYSLEDNYINNPIGYEYMTNVDLDAGETANLALNKTIHPMSAIEIGFKVTMSSCSWRYFNTDTEANRFSDPNEVQCHHLPSQSIGISNHDRSRHLNRGYAFQRMTQTEQFIDWCAGEIMSRGKLKNTNIYFVKQKITIEVDLGVARIVWKDGE